MSTGNQQTTRRDFIKRTSAGIAAAGFAIAPGRVLGANEKIRMGIIGVGDRGSWGMRESIKQGAETIAVCDVYETRLNAAIESAGEMQNGRKPKPYKEFRKLLENKDIDAVFVGTPDHWHHDMLIASVKAGKDVYQEKPFSKTIEQGKNMVKEVRKTDRIVQIGNHRHSGKHWARAAETVNSGKLGDVVWIHVTDLRDWSRGDPWARYIDNFTPAERAKLDWETFLGPAPRREFDVHRYFTWRWYWDYAGGLLTDIGAHQLDIAQWMLDALGANKVVANGGNYYFDNWETPDVVHLTADYGDACVTFSVEFISNRMHQFPCVVHGSDAQLLVEGYHFKVLPRGSNEPIEEWDGEYEGPAHMRNFLDCVKSRKQPNSTVELGHRVITTAHLGNISYREKKVVEWDPKKEEFL